MRRTQQVHEIARPVARPIHPLFVRTGALPRKLIVVLFIILSSLWLLYSGFRQRSVEYSQRDFRSSQRDFSTDNYKNFSNLHEMAAASRTPFIIKESGKASGLVIFLHGLGDTGQGWSQEFGRIKVKNVRYMFPNAGAMKVTLNMGMVMPSWFDIVSLNMQGAEDEKGIKNAAENVRTMMKQEQEKLGIPSSKVILGGFSMGGALALYTGLTHPEPLGGLILLSSWLPLRNEFEQKKSGECATKQLCPIFQGHGMADPMVNVQYGNATHEIIKKLRETSAKTVFKTYRDMGHGASDEELNDVRDFIQENLPAE